MISWCRAPGTRSRCRCCAARSSTVSARSTAGRRSRRCATSRTPRCCSPAPGCPPRGRSSPTGGLAGGLPAAAWPLLLKPPYGDNGDGIVRVDSPRDLERLPWPDGMVLAQHYVDVAGVDVKLYGAGTEVWAARGPRRCSRRDRGTSRCPCRSPKSCGVRSGLPRRLRAGAVRRGRAAVPGGPLVVDVNDFPNYTGIAEAPDAVADLVESRLAEVVPS